MKLWLKKVIFWFIAFVITIGAVVFQRMTGPTYPMKIQIEFKNEVYKNRLPRSHELDDKDCIVELKLPSNFEADLVYRRYPSNDKWDTITMSSDQQGYLRAKLPVQPPAGKLEYHLNIYDNGNPIEYKMQDNVVIRFKGEVPEWVLIPHILFMFLAMLWSNATGLQAAVNLPNYKRNAQITVILFFIGGMILGPIVQKYAFGAYWTGWPFGEDLTDNKVLFSVLIWIAAILLNRKKERKWLIIVATLFLFAIYMIPHSMRGSELDYTTGEVMTGSVLFLVSLQKTLRTRK